MIAYVLSIAGAALWHADYILHDAVVGISVVVVIYSAFLSPVAIVASGCFLYPAFDARARLALALLFAVLVGLGVHALLVAAQSPHLEEVVMTHDVGSFVLLSVALSAVFVAITFAARRTIQR